MAEFSFKLRKKDLEGGLGLQVYPTHAGALCIRHVWHPGAVHSWNKICASTRPEVRPGDLIIKVNNVSCDASHMLDECRKHTFLVKFTVKRGLNAEAPAFVPGRPAWTGRSSLDDVCDSTRHIRERVQAQLATCLAIYHLENSGDQVV